MSSQNNSRVVTIGVFEGHVPLAWIFLNPTGSQTVDVHVTDEVPDREKEVAQALHDALTAYGYHLYRCTGVLPLPRGWEVEEQAPIDLPF